MRRIGRTGWLALLPLVVACATPVGVDRVGAREVIRELGANALTDGRPSLASVQLLNREYLRERFEQDPDAALDALHERFRQTGDPSLLFPLAELSFMRAVRERDRDRVLLAAIYAYAFLFPDAAEGKETLDPRVRLAADLYNRGLALGLRSEDGTRVRLESGSRALPTGRLEVTRVESGFHWGGFVLHDFVPAEEYAVRGLRNRYRRPGLGAPLIAALEPDAQASAQERRWIPPRLRVPVTAVLRVSSPRKALVEGTLRGTLELYAADADEFVEIGPRRVPLEFEPTSSLAYTLEYSPIWDFELRGFFLADLNPLPNRLDTEQEPENGLFMMQPHRPGRIPLVLVHGTASSPARWAEMVNELTADPRVRRHYQVWLFMYNTGNPVSYSGALLREALRDAVAELDPDGSDPALRRMVVAGHSQGGLLTKLTVVRSGDAFWNEIAEVPIDEMELTPETRDLLQRALFVEPVPSVKSVIFIATPHQGSFLARRRLGRLVSYFVTRPSAVVAGVRDMVDSNPDRVVMRSLDRVPSSIDNMNPGNPFLQALSELPIVPGVEAHSIIPVKREPIETGDDGVVKYQSAHVSGIPEKVILGSGHSTQSHPETIAEVRRILLEHAEAP